MDVGPARQPRSPLVFRVGAEPHFPCLERFPTGSLIMLCADILASLDKLTDVFGDSSRGPITAL